MPCPAGAAAEATLALAVTPATPNGATTTIGAASVSSQFHLYRLLKCRMAEFREMPALVVISASADAPQLSAIC
jgi:hypothetical protein